MQSLAGALREISEGNRQPVAASAAPLRRREGAMKSDKPGLFGLWKYRASCSDSWVLLGLGLRGVHFAPWAAE